MGKLKQILKNKRVLILIAFLLLSVYMISPQLTEGVSIRGVIKNSAAANAFPNPLLPPSQTIKPTGREVILSVNDIPVNTVKEYFDITSEFIINQTVTVKTDKNTYFLTVKPEIETTILNETESVEVTKVFIDEETNETINKTVIEIKNKTIENILGPQDIGLNVYEKPSNNIKKGLDLEGGTRVLLKPQSEIDEDDMKIVLESIKQRLDVYGVGDVTVRTAKDFFGNTYISVEIAGVNEEEVKQLLTSQGKFEAKIGENVVFRGGDRDILFVCRSAQCSSIDDAACSVGADGNYFCGFRFSITLSQKAAEAQASATANLDVVDLGIQSGQGSRGYLSENITLFLDDELIDSLRIASSLKGNPTTSIQISGSGSGVTKKAAREDALINLRQLQTVLITGSLPVKLDIAETNTISPILGESFIKNAILAGIVAILVVIAVVTIRYRQWKIALPMAITMLSEVLIILGFASLIGWRIDMIAIAAIVIAIGSGVDDQIVITDETISREKKEEAKSWKQKLKSAFFIIMASYFTLIVAMVPLMFAGAGLLLGFAITTVAGVTIGVLITRPAFAAILEILIDK